MTGYDTVFHLFMYYHPTEKAYTHFDEIASLSPESFCRKLYLLVFCVEFSHHIIQQSQSIFFIMPHSRKKSE